MTFQIHQDAKTVFFRKMIEKIILRSVFKDDRSRHKKVQIIWNCNTEKMPMFYLSHTHIGTCLDPLVSLINNNFFKKELSTKVPFKGPNFMKTRVHNSFNLGAECLNIERQYFRIGGRITLGERAFGQILTLSDYPSLDP